MDFVLLSEQLMQSQTQCQCHSTMHVSMSFSCMLDPINLARGTNYILNMGHLIPLAYRSPLRGKL